MNIDCSTDNDNINNIKKNLKPCIIVLGMAGSGKTSFVQQLTCYLNTKKFQSPYIINLDPAVSDLPYPANIDIRDTIKYKSIMKEYCLGPNGAITTSLNLICTRFNLILDVLKKRNSSTSFFIFDTPGQIESFTWSASGTIITDCLASNYPTVIAYIDIARAMNPITFMSNMLYACSILYRNKLPFFIVFNKSDVADSQHLKRWMNDFDAFQNVLQNNDSSYINDLTRSLSLVLDSFYENLNNVTVSSRTGEGFEQIIEVIEKCKDEYWTIYKPMYDQLKKSIKLKI